MDNILVLRGGTSVSRVLAMHQALGEAPNLIDVPLWHTWPGMDGQGNKGLRSSQKPTIYGEEWIKPVATDWGCGRHAVNLWKEGWLGRVPKAVLSTCQTLLISQTIPSSS
jgi:hypothetical protein